MRAGRTLRALQAIAAAPACASCGHFEAHREREYQSEGYEPLVFHCSAPGCDCVIDKRTGAK